MREKININKDWLFSKSAKSAPNSLPTDWEKVNLPHTWNGTDGQDGGNDYYRGKCFYAKSLKKSELGDSSVHYLEFEAVNSSAEVYWNTKLIGRHDGGYSTKTCSSSRRITARTTEFIRRSPTSHSTAVYTAMFRSYL